MLLAKFFIEVGLTSRKQNKKGMFAMLNSVLFMHNKLNLEVILQKDIIGPLHFTGLSLTANCRICAHQHYLPVKLSYATMGSILMVHPAMNKTFKKIYVMNLHIENSR